MEYQPDFRGMAEFLRGPDAARVTALAAGAGLARMRGLVGHDSGETARSGRLLHGTGGRRSDRVRTTIAFDGAMVPQQFGNQRTRATRPMTRAWEQI
jgi:hypothetical protein